MNRTLWMSMAGAALALAACGTGDASLQTPALDQDQPDREIGWSEEANLRASPTLDPIFQAAGTEFKVPPALLKAIGWAATRYEMVAADIDFDNAPDSFGLMGLGGEVLPTGASLAAVTVDQAKMDATANIRAAAAWLDAEATAQSLDRSKLINWVPVVAGFSRIEDFQARQAFVKGEVFGAITEGVGTFSEDVAASGQALELEAAVGEIATVSQGLSRSPDYERGVWRPSPNFSARSGRVSMVIIHTCEGAYSGCYGWLANPRAGASAHYVVSSDGREVSQLVRESSKAWHIAADYACSRNSNKRCDLNGVSSNNFTVGIEHAGFASQSSWPASQIDASARLVCDITQDHGIPRDRFHVVGHGQLQPWNRTDPGRNWPWTSYLAKVNSFCGTTPAPTPTPTPTPIAPPNTSTITIDSNNANNNQARGYLQVSANWKSSTNIAGYYGSGYWYASTAPVSDGAAFFFKLDAAGARSIEAWWTAASDRSPDATFVAINAQGQKVGEGSVNQSRNGGKWNAVGRFNFTAGWNKIVLSRWSASGKVVIADAVRVR
ncbi:MAG: N-acetylmuramoyl-L-alanine amidase [Myxococcales bacterium]|nr:N-acetylmuramoyl-L-alanine amidase [Myxococcales bacterium]